MPARLIINADDFGLTPGINRAVEQLHQAGVLTSATLMARGPAFPEAVAIAGRNPSLGVGCHIVLIDGAPVSDPTLIRSLLGPGGSGAFRSSLPCFLGALSLGAIREDDIQREAIAQIRELQSAGIDVTHVDTHKHTHIFPVVSRALCRAAAACGVHALRNPFEPAWSVARGGGSPVRRLEVRLLRNLQSSLTRSITAAGALLQTTSGTLGIAATGTLGPANLRRLLHDLPQGTWELVCHPAFLDPALESIPTSLRQSREIERLALLEVVPEFLSKPTAPTLIHFGHLVRSQQP